MVLNSFSAGLKANSMPDFQPSRLVFDISENGHKPEMWMVRFVLIMDEIRNLAEITA